MPYSKRARTEEFERRAKKMNTDKTVDIDSFVSKYSQLIDLERETEHQEISEKREFIKNGKFNNAALTNLIIRGSSAKLYDKIPVTFGLEKNRPLPTLNRFKVGDPVIVGGDNPSFSVIRNGVIRSCDKKTLTILINKELSQKDAETFFIFKPPNGSSYRRMQFALNQLHIKADEPLMRVAFGRSDPFFDKIAATKDFPFVNQNLNEEQQEATVKALGAQDIFIIHGPPGTGKTTTLVEIIQQFVKQEKKVLVCAGSNAAVDIITEKLYNKNKHIDMVRLGHIARFNPEVLEVSLDAILAKSNSDETISDMRSHIKLLDRKMDSTIEGHERHLLMKQKIHLCNDLRMKEVTASETAIKKAKVVLSTVFFDSILNTLKEAHFDIVVIDECSQIIEPACWVAMLKANRCILAGDHCQLPPVVKSEKADKKGLRLSLMERLCKLHGDTITTMLSVQYRMHKNIMTWPSKQFYNHKLIAHSSVASHLLKDLPDVEETENTSQPIVVIDTVATNCIETCPESTDESRGNHGEADLVAMYVANLIDSGVKAKDIGIITPYNLQVTFIKQRLNKEAYEGLEIKSIDSFQGREKEAIVLSMVRSNEEDCYGFLSDNRRINVAITRAKRHLAMICNSKTVSCQPLLKDFLDFVSKGHGEIRSATQYNDFIGIYDRQERATEIKTKKPKQKLPLVEMKTKPRPVPMCWSNKPNHQVLEDWLSIDHEYHKQIQTFLDSPQSTLSLSAVSKDDHNVVSLITKDCCSSLKCSMEEFSMDDNSVNVQIQKPAATEYDDEQLANHMVTDVSFVNNLNEGDDFLCNNNPDDTIEADDCNDDNDISEENVLKVGGKTDSDGCVSEKSVLNFGTKGNKEKIEGIVHKNTLDSGKDSNKKTIGTLPKYLPQKKENKKSEPKSSNTAPKLKEFPKMKEGDEDDFHAIINSVVKADNLCSLLKCQGTILPYLPSSCDYCKRRFCSTHFMPEIHGCDTAVRADVRSQIRKEGTIYPGSGKPDKKPDSHKMQLLHRLLQKKMDKCSNERKRKLKAK